MALELASCAFRCVSKQSELGRDMVGSSDPHGLIEVFVH